MSDEEIRIFTEGLIGFFSQNLGDASVLEMGGITQCDPSESPAYDLTGIIGISGDRRGCIYFTAEEDLVKEVLVSMGETDIDNELLNDMTGEIANTIAGNVMSSSDTAFELSVPVVVAGKPNSIYLPKNISAYVIHASWKGLIANLVVCVE